MKTIVTAVLCAGTTLCSFAARAEAGRNPAAAVILHALAYSKTMNGCTALSAVITDCESANPTADPAWTDVLVGLYAFQSPEADPDPDSDGLSPGLHLTGIDLGLAYDANNLVVGWTKCGDLEVPTTGADPPENPFPAWPLPGSGNTVVWAATQRGPISLVGFFRIAVYGAGTLDIVSNPIFSALRVLDDESNLDDITRVGVAGFGGATGSNQCSVAVRATTWGNIKSLFRR